MASRNEFLWLVEPSPISKAGSPAKAIGADTSSLASLSNEC